MTPALRQQLSKAMNRLATAFLPCLLALPCAAQQDLPQLFNSNDVSIPLDDADRHFIQHRIDQLQLAENCRRETVLEEPRADFRYLAANGKEGPLRLYILPDVVRSREAVLVLRENGGMAAYTNCRQDVNDTLLPVLAIIATVRHETDSDSNQTRQAVLASHSYLTSHEPSMLMPRNDSLDSSATYLDFQVSAKHPLFANSRTLNQFHAHMADLVEELIPGDEEYFMQLYLAFTGRFSQYIFERDSAPVVARTFNPAIFYRFWSSARNYLDVEFGHESNGQRIHSPDALWREQQEYIRDGEPAFYARDSLSRGWDYMALTWQRSWGTQWSSQLRARHFLNHGPLQGKAEEYNTWEDGGTRNRPRRQYDGLSLGLRYEFSTSPCLLGDSHVCFRNLKYRFDTGYSAPFDNNTSTLELTTDFFGIPIQLWAKTGYNTNLVDYYRHTTSWGLGIELLSR